MLAGDSKEMWGFDSSDNEVGSRSLRRLPLGISIRQLC